jgi:hypothetical protein
MNRLLRLQRKLTAKTGSAIIEVLICITFLTFVLFYPIFTFAYTQKINRVEDVLTTGIQMVAVRGGLDNQVADAIYANLEAKNLLPAGDAGARDKVILSSNADVRTGASGTRIYRDDSDPKIYLEIKYPANREVQFINGLSKMIGAGSGMLPFHDLDGTVTYYYVARGYIMSEKVDY